MEVIANNIANANTTSGADGKVYRRKQVVFSEQLSDTIQKAEGRRLSTGVRVSDTVEDMRDLKKVFRPGHPDADKDGFVSMPNVNPVEEMVDMMSSVRSYEANLAAIRAARKMADQALGISK
jgi:flagellar basal-body rod protein FlgC